MFTAWCCTVVKVHCSPHRQTENVNNSWCDRNKAISLSVLYVQIEKETTGLKTEQLRVYRIMFLFIISIKAASIHQFTRVLMSTSSQLTDRRRNADESPQINVLIFYFTRIKYLTYSAICIYISADPRLQFPLVLSPSVFPALNWCCAINKMSLKFHYN